MKPPIKSPIVAATFLALAAYAAKNLRAQTAVTVTVDYSVHTGPSNQIASGFLHGISANDPSQYLVDGIKASQVRGMAYIGTEVQGNGASAQIVTESASVEPGQYQPNLFDSATYTRVTATGAKLMVGLYYYVDQTGCTYWPGDGGNETTWRTVVANLYNYSQSKGLNVYSWLPWNEPNGQWSGSLSPGGSVRNTAAYYQAWLNAYQVIKGLNPNARVQGPEASTFSGGGYIESFLAFCQQNNCLPDILSWHELPHTGSAPEDVESDAAALVTWMKAPRSVSAVNGIKPNDNSSSTYTPSPITPMPLAVTEYSGGTYYPNDPSTYSPGTVTTFIAKLERAAVASNLAFGVKSCWDYNSSDSDFIATLADQADYATATFPAGGWWTYNAYKDATGVAISETSSDTSVVDCFAAYDVNMWRSLILLGDPVGGSSSNVTLFLKNLNDSSSLMNNGTTHLRVETLTGANSLTEPTVALEGDYSTTDNSLTVALPTLASQNAYRILVNSAIATAPTTYFEAHELPVTYTPGVVFTTYTESGSRDGTACSLNATAVGQEVTFTISVAAAGVYDLRGGLKGANSHAMLQLYLNGSAVGGPKDEYTGGATFYNDDFGNVNLPAGNSTLKFVAVNKNPSSSDYTMSFDYFELIQLLRN